MAPSLESEIQALKARNQRVEVAKAWEVSLFRRGLLTAFTYAMAYLFMAVAELDHAAVAACVPAGAYLISTLTVGPLREFWIRHFYKRDAE